MGKLLEGELQSALDFCSGFFRPTSPEQRAYVVRCGLSGDFFDIAAPLVDPKKIDEALASAKSEPSDDNFARDSDVRLVAQQVNARRVLHGEFTVNNLEAEEINGYVVRLERGSLGLMQVQ